MLLRLFQIGSGGREVAGSSPVSPTDSKLLLSNQLHQSLMVGDVSGKSLQTAKEHGFSRFPIFGGFLWDADVLVRCHECLSLLKPL